MFYNVFKMFERLGFASTEVGMQCSFGKGEEFWTNVFPSEVIDQCVLVFPVPGAIADDHPLRFSADIKRFGRVLNMCCFPSPHPCARKLMLFSTPPASQPLSQSLLSFLSRTCSPSFGSARISGR